MVFFYPIDEEKLFILGVETEKVSVERVEKEDFLLTLDLFVQNLTSKFNNKF